MVFRGDPGNRVVAFIAAEVDLVVYATPVDLSRLVTINKPMAAVEYEFKERGPQLQNILTDFDARLVIVG